MNPIRCLLLGAALCFTGASAFAATAETATQPKLDVTTLDGKAWALSAQRGQWTVINFWATWCSPCIAEMPELDAFDHERKDAVVIGLSFEETEAADLKAFLQKHPVSYPIAAVDPWNPPADFAEPRGLPTTYLIDPQGQVAKHFIGPITGKMLAQAIDAAKAAARPDDAVDKPQPPAQ